MKHVSSTGGLERRVSLLLPKKEIAATGPVNEVQSRETEN
jgi:hypothetical protein